MKNSKFSEVQIIKILSEQNQGKTINETCREHNISQLTFYKWKSKYGGLDVQQLSKPKKYQIFVKVLEMISQLFRSVITKGYLLNVKMIKFKLRFLNFNFY